MTTTSKSTTIKVGSLLLDANNTRIPADRRSKDQRHLLHELLEHEEVKDLASSITKLGLFPNERLVVMPSGKRFTVLEGNRRLAAMKLLLNPELAPSDTTVRYFRKLSARADLLAIGKVEVVVVADRVVAAPIIAALHTRGTKKRWSSLQQARFYRELVDEGQTPIEIAESVGVALGEVRSFLRAEKLYRLALPLDYDEHVRRKIEDSNYPLTTLERFLESKVGRKFLGVELDEKEGFRGVVHPDRFRAVIARVAEDVAMKKAFTRDINDEAGFQSYIDKTDRTIAKTKMRGSFDPSVLLGEKQAEDTERGGQDKQPKLKHRTVKPSPSVIPRGFVCNSKHDRVRAIFNEIKSMKIVEQRNSTGVMLRVLLDIALWKFLETAGHEKSACNHFDPGGSKRKHNPDWTPALRDLISFAVDKRLFPGMTAAGYKAVRSLASRDAGYFITIEGFNSFTHNPNVTPTEGDLRALWQRAEPMLQIILTQ